jgi:hypothetical protein
VRAWHSRALAEVAMALTRDQAPKTGPRQTRSRKPMRRQR